MTRLSASTVGQPAPAGQAGQPEPDGSLLLPGPPGPVERLMSTVIRKLAWSRLAQPKVAVAISGAGLLLGMLVGATAPNPETLIVRLPLSHLLPSLQHQLILSMVLLYGGDILACLGLAGMLWAHSQGWRPDPRLLLLASAAVVAILVCLTPVGSSDTASYAAYGRIAAQGGNPYTTSPHIWGDPAYTQAVGALWKNQVSVYGPIATAIQAFAASIGGASVAHTIWVLMILNGAVFIGVGVFLLKTSDDPVRATLFWAANPVLIQQLVSGGHFDTFVAAAMIVAIQVARRMPGLLGDALVGLVIGLGVGIKVSAVLIGLGLAWPLLQRREWLRVARMAAISLAVVALEYSFYGLTAIRPMFGGSQWVSLPSPWWFVQIYGELMGVSKPAMTLVITALWPIAMLVIAYLTYRAISPEQPREIVAPFALTFAWVVVAPWAFPWYTAIAWVALTLVPRNRMTRWLTIVTVFLALAHSSGGQGLGHSIVNGFVQHYLGVQA